MQEDTYRGDGLNLYAYCGNNPVMYYDPSGYKNQKNLICKTSKVRETDITNARNISTIDLAVVKKIIDNIPKRLKKFGECDRFAQNLVDALGKKEIPYKIIRIDSQYLIYSDKVGDSIGASYHYGIQIDDIVYDNMTTDGMKLNDWLCDLGLLQGLPGIKWSYATEIINK